ncbi:hypothetical protein N7462_009894 [Penicillium macrosclerotiorum]|uniref:uncharacterized protein n=1 Tax=Penicillium macrosclerotiorum TaxID=303699 RepID=UPI002546670E|nr:uncharacterized protein N7462_009894 [Penicillium macrosclerotiorum]KAJ5668824.1 hypothetical protein N7462_009894 [Penicillium macrosclerotiorum]
MGRKKSAQAQPCREDAVTTELSRDLKDRETRRKENPAAQLWCEENNNQGPRSRAGSGVVRGCRAVGRQGNAGWGEGGGGREQEQVKRTERGERTSAKDKMGSDRADGRRKRVRGWLFVDCKAERARGRAKGGVTETPLALPIDFAGLGRELDARGSIYFWTFRAFQTFQTASTASTASKAEQPKRQKRDQRTNLPTRQPLPIDPLP